MKGNAILGLAALTITSSLYAGTMGEVQTGPRGGWVIGADIGYGYLNTQEEEIASPTAYTIPPTTEIQDQTHKIGDLVGGGYLGYNFPVSDRLLAGLEFGYKYQGRSKYHSHLVDTSTGSFINNEIKINQQAVDALLTGKYFVWGGLNLIAKAGAAYVHSRTKQDNSFNIGTSGFLCTNAAIWRIKPEVDLGFGYRFDKVDLNLTYTHIGGVDTNVTGLFRFYNSGPDRTPAVFEYNALTVGLSYTFGA